ncbi:unnamed protein product [Amoebophrya sp. A25]|nr:unnamed protein product [Amoebophrya sp. A25]|eukprot:GSA25T00007482001.1
MTGVLESVVIGGAAWGAVEAYRDSNEKKKQQRRLVSELFAKLFGLDFQSVAPDRTTHLRSLKSGSDADVAAAYHFLHHFQEKRTKTIFQDLFQGEEARGDVLTMVSEYLKAWLSALPKSNELRAFATAQSIQHLEFSRQILMRPKLFRTTAKENAFGVAVAHFADHLERFYERVSSTERNAGHVIEQILTQGKELVQQALPVFLFALSCVVSGDSDLPCFDSVTLAQAFVRDCKAAAMLRTGGELGASAQQPSGGSAGHTTATSAPRTTTSVEDDYVGTTSSEKASKEMKSRRRRNALAWDTHIGKLLYLFLRTKHFTNLMDTADGLGPVQTPEEAAAMAKVAKLRGEENLLTLGGADRTGIEMEPAFEIMTENTPSTLGDRGEATAAARDHDMMRDEEFPCYVDEADVNGDYLPGYNFEPSEMDRKREEFLRKQQEEEEEEEKLRRMGVGVFTLPGNNLTSSAAGGDGNTTPRAAESAQEKLNRDTQKHEHFFLTPPKKETFEKGSFADHLGFTTRQWDVHLEFSESGLLPKFRALDPEATLSRSALLDFFRKIDNLVYFLSVLQIYNRLSLLGGDPMICFLYASIQHLLHEMEFLLTDAYRLAELLAKKAKSTLQDLAKEPASLREHDMRYMNLLQHLDTEGFKSNHKKLFSLFTELRSLSASERVPQLKLSIQANLEALAHTVSSDNFQTRCALPLGNTVLDNVLMNATSGVQGLLDNAGSGSGGSILHQAHNSGGVTGMITSGRPPLSLTYGALSGAGVGMQQNQQTAVTGGATRGGDIDVTTPTARNACTSSSTFRTRGGHQTTSSSSVPDRNAGTHMLKTAAGEDSRSSSAHEHEHLSTTGDLPISQWDSDALGDFYYGEPTVAEGIVKDRVSVLEQRMVDKSNSSVDGSSTAVTPAVTPSPKHVAAPTGELQQRGGTSTSSSTATAMNMNYQFGGSSGSKNKGSTSGMSPGTKSHKVPGEETNHTSEDARDKSPKTTSTSSKSPKKMSRTTTDVGVAISPEDTNNATSVDRNIGQKEERERQQNSSASSSASSSSAQNAAQNLVDGAMNYFSTTFGAATGASSNTSGLLHSTSTTSSLLVSTRRERLLLKYGNAYSVELPFVNALWSLLSEPASHELLSALQEKAEAADPEKKFLLGYNISEYLSTTAASPGAGALGGGQIGGVNANGETTGGASTTGGACTGASSGSSSTLAAFQYALASEHGVITEANRFEALLGRTAVAPKYARAVKAVVLTPTTSTASVSLVHWNQFVLALRLLGHSQVLQRREEEGDEFFAEVPLATDEVDTYCSFAPSELATFTGLSWDTRREKLKILEPL